MSVQFFFSTAPDPLKTPEAGQMAKFEDYEYRPWFEGNGFPRRILNAVEGSPTNGGIIAKKAAYTKGASVEVVAKDPAKQYLADILSSRCSEGEGIAELLGRLAMDYYTFGCFAMHPYGIGGQVTGIEHIDMSQLRRAKRKIKVGDTDTIISGWLACTDWIGMTKEAKDGVVFYRDYMPGVDFGKADYVLVYSGYTPGKQHYPLPDWYSGLRSAETEIHLMVYKSASVQNSFNPSGIVHINGLTVEQQAAFNENFAKNVSGPQNAGRAVIVHSSAGDTTKPEFIPMSTSPIGTNVDAYADACVRELVTAHQIPSLTLLGLQGGPSLSGDGATIEQAVKVFNEQTIKPVRRLILDRIKRIYLGAGLDVDILIEDYDLTSTAMGVQDIATTDTGGAAAAATLLPQDNGSV